MLPKVKTFILEHWRVVAIAAALLCAFAVGRYETPPKTVTTAAVVDHSTENQLAQAREQINTLTQQVATLKTKKHEVKTVAVKPDGSKTIQTVTDTDTDQATHSQTAQQTVATQQVQTQTEVTHSATTSVTVTTVKPQWRVSALAGVDVLHLNQPALLGPVQLGALVERRLIGPVWVGAFGLSSGTAGLALSLEF